MNKLKCPREDRLRVTHLMDHLSPRIPYMQHLSSTCHSSAHPWIKQGVAGGYPGRLIESKSPSSFIDAENLNLRDRHSGRSRHAVDEGWHTTKYTHTHTHAHILTQENMVLMLLNENALKVSVLHRLARHSNRSDTSAS
jgi:hypothetical protein